MPLLARLRAHRSQNKSAKERQIKIWLHSKEKKKKKKKWSTTIEPPSIESNRYSYGLEGA